MLSRVVSQSLKRVAGTRQFSVCGKLLAPPKGGPGEKKGKKLHIVPEFKEDDLDWKEVPKTRAQEEHWARERERAILEQLVEQGKVVVQAPASAEKHFFVKYGDKDPYMIAASDFNDFKQQVEKWTGNSVKSLKTAVKVENDEYKMDFDDKMFKKFNDKMVYVE